MSFKAFIELKDQILGTNNGRYPLAAGMQLSAEIVAGKRTVLDYLQSPVQRVANEAGENAELALGNANKLVFDACGVCGLH